MVVLLGIQFQADVELSGPFGNHSGVNRHNSVLTVPFKESQKIKTGSSYTWNRGVVGVRGHEQPRVRPREVSLCVLSVNTRRNTTHRAECWRIEWLAARTGCEDQVLETAPKPIPKPKELLVKGPYRPSTLRG